MRSWGVPGGGVGGVHVLPVVFEGAFGDGDQDGGASAHPVVHGLHGDVGAFGELRRLLRRLEESAGPTRTCPQPGTSG
jgi:hypothetical protein